jgi:hypothetical protein
MIGMVLVFVAAVLMISQGTITAQDCRIIRIHGQGFPDKSVWLEPETLLIPKNGCIIWINFAKGNVKVIFEEGKKCKDVTEAPSAFSMDHALGCYVSSFVDVGATSSLKFVEEGTFSYKVEIEGISDKATGSIVVR